MGRIEDSSVLLPCWHAFNCALETGTKYVIVINGDRYAIYDNDEGRTYDEKLSAEFDLTDLTEKGLLALQSLRKGD